ncbi:MAG TPA: hypothetical protein VEI01_00490 [Terriglobales bacterium]|nr:hypothetical protein [Terriglobales bacterium]
MLCLIPGGLSRASAQNRHDYDSRFRLTSTTFENGSTLPLTMIGNRPSPSNPNLNACTLDGSPGGNQSPELSWSHAPRRTRSFVVIAYDVTAAFTHWGMYNIAPETTRHMSRHFPTDHSLLKAGREGHILASASISGFYSAAALPPGPTE